MTTVRWCIEMCIEGEIYIICIQFCSKGIKCKTVWWFYQRLLTTVVSNVGRNSTNFVVWHQTLSFCSFFLILCTHKSCSLFEEKGFCWAVVNRWAWINEALQKQTFCIHILMRKNKSRKRLEPFFKWATSWQNQQTYMCAQRRLRSAWASAQSDKSSLCAYWVAKDRSFLHADSDDSDQTRRMPRLIWVFAGRTCHFVGFVTRRLKFYICCRNRKAM